MSQSQPVLVLIGPPGAGKSAVGRLTARLLGTSFVDTDQRIVKQFGPISTIFADQGEPVFRELERSEVLKAFATKGVVALGGGAVLHLQTQHDLMKHRVAYLGVSAEAVRTRILSPERPLLRDGIDSWQKIMSDRREIYQRLANIKLDSSHRTVGSIAHELAGWVQQEVSK